MSTAENTAPATLPAVVTTWLTAPGDSDNRVAIEQWGGALELVAERGPWHLFIAIDGRTAGLQYTGDADADDLGRQWPFALRDLGALLSDPRVAAQIADGMRTYTPHALKAAD